MLGLYGRIAPRQAARLLADLISRPGGQNPTQPWELAHGTDGKAIELRTGLKARSWGESGPLVLALHGWRGRTTQFRPLAAMLLARGMRTVALELPGHGISTGDSATPRLIGELLIEIERITGPGARRDRPFLRRRGARRRPRLRVPPPAPRHRLEPDARQPHPALDRKGGGAAARCDEGVHEAARPAMPDGLHATSTSSRPARNPACRACSFTTSRTR